MTKPLIRLSATCLALAAALLPCSAFADDLGSARLQIAGTRLTVSPESQTVPYSTATIVETHLEGYDAASGVLPADLKVVGDFTGPEIDGILRLEALPNEPFRIPRLSVKGQYQLDNIRLVQGEDLLAYAEPRSAGVLVTQVLVTRVTSRALSLEEIRSHGIVVDDDRFHAFNFTFGFAVDGETFNYNVPVIYDSQGEDIRSLQILRRPLGLGGSTGTSSPRFKPPQMAPFTLTLDRRTRGSDAFGGCVNPDGCYQSSPVSLPGVILFPTDVSLLNQFFSVMVVAKNDAPEGDPLVIRDLTATPSVPPGLRLAETEPPTPLGVPVPVRVPGADGRLGTADDITFLIAQAEGQAEVLVEGRKQGTHVVDFDLEGVLEGFPDGKIRRVTGKARGAVVVRDPTLGLTITHPDVVRVDEEYSLLLTLSNTGNAPVNLLSVTLPTAGLSGVEVVGDSSKTVETLPPGESEVVELRLRSLRTGKVVASTIRHGSQIDPTFELSVGVGEAGIPLSPDAIILPDSTSHLPQGLVRNALGLVGLGYSVATAPASSLHPDLPQLGLERLHEKVYWLGQAGRHVELGEDPFDSTAVLAVEWAGLRGQQDWAWDRLRRITSKGALVGDSFAQVFAAEAAATGPVPAFERFAATTAYLGEHQAALGVGSGVSVSVRDRVSGKRVALPGTDPLRVRDLPFSDLYDLGGSQMAVLVAPGTGGSSGSYTVRIEDSDGGSGELHLLVPDADGALRVVRWTGLSFSPGGSAEVDYAAADSLFTLALDGDGDGVVDSEIPGTESILDPRPFEAISAVQAEEAASGHTLEVLFTRDIDLDALLPRDPARFTLPGNVSNGGLVEVERDLCAGALGGCNPTTTSGDGTGNPYHIDNPFAGLLNTRVVEVVFSNPVSPYKPHELGIRDVTSLNGVEATNLAVPVQTTVTDPGTIVQGTVYGPDGQPVPYARVELLETDKLITPFWTDCLRHRTAGVQADASGRFELDYVRQTACSDQFEIRGTDTASGHSGSSRGRVRFVGETVQLDVLMLGRGTVRGRVTYEDGTVPESFQVVGYSPVFYEGREATYGPDGTYEIRGLPVGTISLGASDREGSFVYQTVELPSAGAVTERNLTIIRRAPEEETGDVRGTVYATDGTTPVYDAYVALYVDGELAGVERSGVDGTFDFGTVPAGFAEIEAFDGTTGQAGAQIYFDVQPDQVNDVDVLLQDDRGAVEGTVYRKTLDTVTPVEGAVVWVSGTPFNTVTDANGHYRLEGVFAGKRTVLAADLESQVQASASVTIGSDGETVYRDLYFVESVNGGLTGRVLGFTGIPVGGAVIHLDDGHGGWWKEAHTDLTGHFTIPDLKPGTYTLFVYKGPVGAVERATIRFEGETPFVGIQFKKGTVRGRTTTVNESGQVVGVTSLVTYRTTVPLATGIVALDYEAHTIETDAEGYFEIPNVLAGRYQLTVTNAFHGEETVRDEIVFHGEVREHDFVFEPTGEVRGVVLDWDGETPVAGADVRLRHPSFSEYDLTTDAEGRFTFSLLPPNSRRFAIEAEFEQGGIYRTAKIWVGLSKPGQELDVEIVLPMQGTVSGWVEDANGAVVPGAVVTLKEGSYPYRKLIHNTDSEGNFSFTNIFAGEVSLSAQAPSLGGLGGRDTVELLEEGQEVFSVVVLEATGEITGTVSSPETGEIVPTVQVTLDRWFRNNYDSVTTTEGEFRFRLLPLHMYRIRVFDPSTGRFGRSDWVNVDVNGQVVDVPVTLEARGDVDGHLYEPESSLGVPGATVQLQTRSLRPFITYSSTDVDGYFEFLGIPEGSFTLKTREPEGRRRASGSGEIVTENERVTVDLYLEQIGRVVGSVLTPEGQPDGLFANANVVLYEGVRVIGATLDNPFAFEDVIADRGLVLRAYENGGDHEGRVKGRLEEGESEVTLDIQMVPRGSAAVTVQDSFGTPVEGAEVELYNPSFYGHKRTTANTGVDGRAVFDGLGQGSISVSATEPLTLLRGSINGELTLDGEQVELVVQLQDSGTIRGHVVTSDGVTPAADALVVVTRGSRTLQTLADGNGDFEFPSVPLGGFTLFAQEDEGSGSIERTGDMAANGQIVDLGTLVLDDELPRVVAMTPESGAADLPLNTVVTVTFSEPIDTSRWSGGWVTFRKLGGGGVSSTPTWSGGNTVLTLTPDAALASFTAYEVIVQDAIDPAGRHLFERVRTTFNTVDVVPPTVVDVVPRDGQNQIPIDASILVTFSEKVAFGSLSGSAFQLTDLTTSTGVTTTFQHLAGERQVLLTPASGLQTDHYYQLTVQGVDDNGGNTMTTPVTTTFWTVDTIPPQITSVDFPAGTSFVSGDDVPVVVTATDDWGVASTGLVIQDWSWTDEAEPWELTGVAPVVASAESLTAEISATDVHGNTATLQQTIDVAPNPNAVAPEVAATCGWDGASAVAGYEMELAARATDDEAVESIRVLVDGQEIGEAAPLNTSPAEGSFLWTPPASAAPDTPYVVRFEARDFAGNVRAHEVTLATPPASATVLEGGTTLFASTWSGTELILARGTYVAPDPLSLPYLVVGRDARLVASTGGAEPAPIVLDVAGTVDVQCGGQIDASAAGYLGGRGPDFYESGQAPDGLIASEEDSGGSHGGSGILGIRNGAVGEVFDSVYEPSLAGGGGAAVTPRSGSHGGDGGGVIEIRAEAFQLGGEILAVGQSRFEGGEAGGAGGTVWVEVGVIAGSGSIDASGGTVAPPDNSSVGGPGGGGRVALSADSLGPFDPASQVKAWGGARIKAIADPDELLGYAAPGTIYVRDSASTDGRLILDAGLTEDGAERSGPPVELPTLGADGVTAFEVSGADAWVSAPVPLRSRWVGAWMALSDGTEGELGAFRVLEVDLSGRALLENAGSVSGAASYRGEYRFDRIEVRNGAGLRADDPVSGTTLVFGGEVEADDQVTAETVVVESGAVVRPSVGGFLRFDVSGTMTVEAGAVIDVSELGYSGGGYGLQGSDPGEAPSWVQAAQAPDGGGGHGGRGGAGGTTPESGSGDAFDSVYEPSLGGGGGAFRSGTEDAHGGDGGGVLTIEAASLVLDGELRARGGMSTKSGAAGAGGAVEISAGTVRGTGSIDVSGADSPVEYFSGGKIRRGGGGGGGRVALTVDTLDGFDPLVQVRARGGDRVDYSDEILGYGAPGTVFVQELSDTYGRLILDNGLEDDGAERSGPPTELPVLGSGSLTAFEPLGGDAWVTGAEIFRPRWVGTWMTLFDGTGSELGTFRVQTIDAAGRALLEGGGAVSSPVSYRGVYRFDRIDALHGSGLDAADRVESTTVVLEGDVEAVADGVVAETVVVKTGSVVRPSVGGSVRFEVSGTMTVEAGAVIDVSGLGYLGGGRGMTAKAPGEAPSWVQAAQGPDAGPSHGGTGLDGWFTDAGDVGEVFDSVYSPSLSGGGGAFFGGNDPEHGGDGGGVVTIEAGTLVVDGQILARGVNNWPEDGTGGAGGTVWIRAATLSGTGEIDASGGDVSSFRTMGTGGGGRIALRVDQFVGFDPNLQVRAWGGRTEDTNDPFVGFGGPGTLFIKELGDTYGQLIVDNGPGRPAPPTQLPVLGSGAVTAFESTGDDAWVTGSGVFRLRWAGAWIVLLDSSSGELGAFRVGEIDGSGRALLEGAGGLSGAASYRGEYLFDRVETRNGAGLEASDPVEGTTLVIEGETETVPEISAESVLIKAGSVVRPATGGSLRFDVSGTMTVEAGAVVEVTGLGYASGTSADSDGSAPSWVAGSTYPSGGSHGGSGGPGIFDAGVPSETFGSVVEPSLGGGGGSFSDGGYSSPDPGSHGGGLIHLDVGTLVLEGELRARALATNRSWAAGGAGGSVTIRADSVSGAGLIDASGGDPRDNCNNENPGSGGGGRVALHVGQLDGFDPSSQVRASGGEHLACEPTYSHGAPGTVFVKQPTDAYGRLILDSGAVAAGADLGQLVTRLPSLGGGAVLATEAQASDRWVTSEEPFRPRWVGTWMVLLDGSGVEIGAFRVVEIDAAGRALLEGASATTGAATYRGEHRFDRVTVRNGAGLASDDELRVTDLVFESDAEVDTALVAETLTVRSGATVGPVEGGSLHVRVSGTMTVEAGAAIDATARGYAGGTEGAPGGLAPPQVAGSTPKAGGSHGGAGDPGETSGVPGEIYDSVYEPSLGGGGGATSSSTRGGYGGGVIDVEAGALVLEGSISALGESREGSWDAAGAGGTVAVRAGSLSGAGLIDVSGGDASTACRYPAPGGGGGGRVALDIDLFDGFDVASQVRAWGGALPDCGVDQSYGAAGTIYVKQPTSVFGDLRIDHGSSSGPSVPATVLPAIGQGVAGIIAVDAQDATDLWIEPQDPDKLFSLGVVGMCVRVDGVDYPVIDQSADRRQLLLDGAAGAVTTGQGFLGIYKFDTVTVTGDAHLTIRDGDEVGSFVIDPGSTLTRLDLDPPSITVTSPAAGTVFVNEDPLTVTAEATDPSGVASVTFTMSGESFTDDAAPYEWSTFAPTVATEQDVDIVVEAVDGEGNAGSVTHTIRVRPPAPGDPPVVTVTCPSPGALLAPGTGLDFTAAATHDDGIDRMELTVGSDPTVVATDSAAPYEFHYDVPTDALEGDVVTLHLRARSTEGIWGEATYPIEVIAANVISGDTTLAAADLSLDGLSVVVAGGTLTVEGPHDFRDLVVLDGASVTHPAPTSSGTGGLTVGVTRDLFVACGGSVDATGKGYPATSSYWEDAAAGFYLADDFEDGDFVGWQVIDDASGSSNWFVDGGALRQTSNIYDGGSPWRGTFAVWSGALPSDDYRFAAHLRSGDNDGIGLMFRYVDPSNYYRFSWHRQNGTRRLERMAEGVLTTLAEDGVVYSMDTWHLVQILAEDTRLEVRIDGEPVFAAEDEAHPAGTVALYSFGNNNARFDDVQITPFNGRSVSSGGSHGGRGGRADPTSRIYGSLFDPADPGAGGGGLSGGAGGGVVRLTVGDTATVDGTLWARGSTPMARGAAGAGGSIRLDAVTITGTGSIDASGGDALPRSAAGGGGRIALYGTSIADALVDRSLAAGGDGDTPEQRGAAGTIFIKRDAQGFGDLILDNGGLDTAQPTELLAVGSGTLDAVGVSSITDDQAELVHDLTGVEVFFNGDDTALWPITGHQHLGQTLDLDVSAQALTAQVGDSYEGLYRFDRIIVRGGAEGVTRSAVRSSSAPEVETGSSWTEAHQPSLMLTDPINGQSFTAGDLVTISASADDLFGVDTVRFEMADRTFVDTTEPFEWTVRTSPVSTVTTIQVTASATDASRNALSDGLSIDVHPNPDASAPVLTRSACPADGDLVAAGAALSFDISANDDDLLYRQTVLVDGVVIDEALEIAQATSQRIVTWTPPAGTTPGTAYLVQFEAEDYGGNVAVETLNLSTPAGTVLTGDQAVDSTFDGSDLVLGSGSFTLSEPIVLSSLSLLQGADLAPSTGGGRVDVTVSGALEVQCGSTLDVTALGFAGAEPGELEGGAPSWVSGSRPDAGGSHGGAGSMYNEPGPAGEVFDSVYEPSLGGGGAGLKYDGECCKPGGAGGGVIELDAGSVVLDGLLVARGADRDSHSAAGAGGTVVIRAGTLSGSGVIDASGGRSTTGTSSGREGSGGGGRVSLQVGSLSGFDPSTQVVAQGGARHRYDSNSEITGYAAPGTVYVLEDGDLYGDLLVDAGVESDGMERIGPATALPVLGSGSVVSVEVASGGLWVTADAVLQPRWVGAWMVLEDASGEDLGAFRVGSVDGSGRALLEGAGSVTGSSGFRGEYRFDRVVLENGAGLTSVDRLETGDLVASGSSRLPATAEVTGNLTVSSGSTVTVADGGRVTLAVSGTLHVESGAALDVTALGFAGAEPGELEGGAPSWVSGSRPDAGGSHGGAGSMYNESGPAGEVFDSVYEPSLGGGGAGLKYDGECCKPGGAGGGVIELDAGSVVLDGLLVARGADRDSHSAAGAGGTVVIRAGTLSGSGVIDASGGRSTTGTSSGREGSGGGGRVSLQVGSLSGFDPSTQVVAQGGARHRYDSNSEITGYAAPGTVYVFEDGGTYGDLLVDAGVESDGTERIGPATALPELGSGTVSVFESASADAWLTGGQVLRPRWTGAWMVLEDASGVELGAFRVVEVDASGRALLSGAGSVVGATSYRGEYRFDEVRLRNGAGLVSADRLDAGSMVAEDASRLPVETVVRGDVTLSSGATISAAIGDRISLEVGGTLTVESGAVLDVSHRGYAGGHEGHPDGYAPVPVRGAGVEFGGSHGGRGDFWNPVSTLPGEVYDSVYLPVLPGGGGALDHDGSGDGVPGGGILDITASAVILDGELRAAGGESDDEGTAAGAGGTVLIEASSLSGTGTVSVDGGFARACSSSRHVGAGGGGRIALRVDDLAGFDVATQAHAFGGAFYSCSWDVYRCTAAGTVFSLDGVSNSGTLYVTYPSECSGTSVISTQLPGIRTGTVGVADPDTDDPTALWIEPQDPAVLFDLGVTGAWVRIAGSDYRIIDQTVDRRRLLLDGAAGIVSVGDAYEGVYKFDTVIVRGGAVLEFLDTADVGTFDVDADSQVITPQ